eukprot:TRINITY_DN25358_c1_g2_i1.p1 TRINITY_DN25358_c1_g2~~TRINITY_DN25358_c1_g2_i1.p1  ORF type:complete len:691 (+),score=126.60 TRINITY_DN25358_c1_g2_i1:113-2185(+)
MADSETQPGAAAANVASNAGTASEIVETLATAVIATEASNPDTAAETVEPTTVGVVAHGTSNSDTAAIATVASNTDMAADEVEPSTLGVVDQGTSNRDTAGIAIEALHTTAETVEKSTVAVVDQGSSDADTAVIATEALNTGTAETIETSTVAVVVQGSSDADAAVVATEARNTDMAAETSETTTVAVVAQGSSYADTAVIATEASNADTAAETVETPTVAVLAQESSNADTASDGEDFKDPASTTASEPLTGNTSLSTFPTMTTAGADLGAQRRSSNLQRPTLTSFLTNLEERVARASLLGSWGAEVHPRSPKQIRSAREPGYELDAHCCLQEARIASGVDNQHGMSRDNSWRSLWPHRNHHAVQDPLSTTQCSVSPKPPHSARSRCCFARRNQRFKSGNEVGSPVTESVPWNPVRGIEFVADSSQSVEQAKGADAGDAKRGVAFLEEQLKEAMVAHSPRYTRPPPGPHPPETRPRNVFASPITMTESSTHQKFEPRSIGPRPGKPDAALRAHNAKLSETQALKLKDTLDTLQGLLGTADDARSARIRPASHRWSPNWAVQNSAPISFRLPAQPGAKAGSPTAGSSDADQIRNDEAQGEQKLDSEPAKQQLILKRHNYMNEQPGVQSAMQAALAADSAASRKKRTKHSSWLPRLRQVPLPAASVLPKRFAKDAPGENTLPSIEASTDRS